MSITREYDPQLDGPPWMPMFKDIQARLYNSLASRNTHVLSINNTGISGRIQTEGVEGHVLIWYIDIVVDKIMNVEVDSDPGTQTYLAPFVLSMLHELPEELIQNPRAFVLNSDARTVLALINAKNTAYHARRFSEVLDDMQKSCISLLASNKPRDGEVLED